nr:DsrE family protein [Allomuricauda sp.]
MKYGPFNALLFCLMTLSLSAQEKRTGPVIADFGSVWKVENPDFKTNTTSEFKVVFDIYDSPDSPDEMNKSIETAARFLNMHAQSGVPTAKLKVALVVHNRASKDIINTEAYRKRFGVANPNGLLVASLLEADVQVILCGQSSNSRGFPKEDLIPGTQIALSAMTAILQLQQEGYQLIKF